MHLRVVVDVYERESRLRRALEELGVELETRRLSIGDYVAGHAIVERKSVRDLHLAIIGGRFWPQVGRLRRVRATPYLLVEGEDIDAGPLRPASVRGALLAVGELGIQVVRSATPEDSALWLQILGLRRRRRARTAAHYAQRPPIEDADAAMLAAVPGISTVSAHALLDRFGTVANVVNAGPENWLSVPGIGPRRAAALAEALSHRRPLPSRARSARPDPST